MVYQKTLLQKDPLQRLLMTGFLTSDARRHTAESHDRVTPVYLNCLHIKNRVYIQKYAVYKCTEDVNQCVQ